MTQPPDQTLLTFPCDFTIKVFGSHSDAFEVEVLSIIHKHIPDIAENALQVRHSENQKYTALSITLPIASKEQLDKIYRELTASPLVLMAL